MVRKSLTSRQNTEGFTVVELLMATVILVPLLTMVILAFMKCMELNEISRISSLGVAACKSKMAQMENTAYNQVFANYNNTTFTINGVNGMGVVYVDNTNPDLLQMTVSFSWKLPNSRLVGEDKNLNGQLNAGEDANGNGILNSTVELVTARDNI